MRRETQRHQRASVTAQIGHHGHVAIQIIEKGPLPGHGISSENTPMAVKAGQKGQPHAGAGAGGDLAQAHLLARGVGRAIGAVMQVMELAKMGIAALQTFHLHLGGNGLGAVRVHPGDDGVHRLPPGPEIVARGAAPLGPAGHGALKTVAVQIGHAGQY